MRFGDDDGCTKKKQKKKLIEGTEEWERGGEGRDRSLSALFCPQYYVIKETGTEGYKQKKKKKKKKLKARMECASLQYSAQPFRDLPLSLGKLNLLNVPSV